MGDLHDIIMYSDKTESTLNRKHCRMFFRNTGTPNSMSKFEKPVEDDALALVLAETYEELGFPVARDFALPPRRQLVGNVYTGHRVVAANPIRV